MGILYIILNTVCHISAFPIHFVVVVVAYFIKLLQLLYLTITLDL